MQAVPSFLKKHENTLLKMLPLAAFTVPLLWLYLLDAGSFELMWKGRTFQLFFVWLIGLELILGWESLQPSGISTRFSAKTFAFIAALMLPTAYVVLANYVGMNTVIAEASRQSGVTWWDSMALSTEYLVFTALFCAMVYLQFGKKRVEGLLCSRRFPRHSWSPLHNRQHLPLRAIHAVPAARPNHRQPRSLRA